MQTLWLIIWRFQPLHKGHELLIQTAIKDCSQVIILLGSSNKNNKNNPYSFKQRKEIIEEVFVEKKVSIFPLPDFQSDNEWKDKIVSYIPQSFQEVNLYCWDKLQDSAVITLQNLKNTLPFTLSIIEIPRSIIHVSASEVREWLENTSSDKLQRFLSEKTIEKLAIYESKTIIKP